MSSSPASLQRCNSNMTSGCGTSEQMQSAGSYAADAANSITESVVTNDHPSSVNSQQPSVQSSSITQQTARQPPMLKKLYQPVTGTNNASACCHHCTTAHNVPCDIYDGNQNRKYNVRYTTDHSIQGPTPAYPSTTAASVKLPVVSSKVQNSMSSPQSCAGSMKVPNASPVLAVSSAPRIPVQCQSQSHCLPDERLTMAMQPLQPSMAHNGSQLAVEAVHSSSPYDMPSHNAQTSRPRQYHQHSVPHGQRFVQVSHQYEAYEVLSPGPSGGKTGCCGQLTLQHTGMPVRFPAPASQQASSTGVHRHAQQPRSVPHVRGSRLPLSVSCASKAAADQANSHYCMPCVSPPPVTANVMQHTESQQLLTSVPVASQHGQLPGGSKAVDFSNQPIAQLLGPRPNAPVSRQCVVYDSDRYTSHGKSTSANHSQHSECRSDLQRLPPHSSSPVVNVPVSGGPRTVSDLLSTIPIQNIDWSIAVPQDIFTVDGFVESVLGHNTASTDSGLQINDSAASGDTPPKTSSPLATDNCNNMSHDVSDSVASRGDDISQQHVNRKKCRDVDAESALCGRLEYMQNKPEITEKLSSHDDRPKLCSVAVNTSLYWPPADIEKKRNAPCTPNDARYLNCSDANIAQPANNLVLQDRGYATCDSPSGAIVSQRPLVSNRDIELVSGNSPGTCDSMVDISFCTPPAPVFPNPSEESIVSEMIMDMPEYTALSNEKLVKF